MGHPNNPRIEGEPKPRPERCHLTDEVAESLPTTGKCYRWFDDGAAPGFHLEVGFAGRKSWVVTTFRRGRLRHIPLGNFPEVGAADARRAALRWQPPMVETVKVTEPDAII